MNSRKIKLFWLLFPVSLFVLFAIALKFLPYFIEEQAFKGPSLEQKTKAINIVISKLESGDMVNNAGLIKVFESQKRIDKSNNELIHSIITTLESYAGAFIGIILVYLGSIFFLYKSLFEKKT